MDSAFLRDAVFESHQQSQVVLAFVASVLNKRNHCLSGLPPLHESQLLKKEKNFKDMLILPSEIEQGMKKVAEMCNIFLPSNSIPLFTCLQDVIQFFTCLQQTGQVVFPSSCERQLF
mmetsp:Transcript_49379/g.127300  ORF Transcript_49379/g.127300 Transcript_49379/m.127300 type:complete len:117 (-) Transcript_49379:24-374(-)